MPESKIRRWMVVLAATALLGLLVAACGSNDSENDNSGDNSAKSTTGSTGATGDTATANETTGQTEPGTGSAVTANTDPVSTGRLFSADSPWNTTVIGLPVAANLQ